MQTLFYDDHLYQPEYNSLSLTFLATHNPLASFFLSKSSLNEP